MLRRVVVAASILVSAPALADHHVKVRDLSPFAAGPLPGAPTIVIKTKAAKNYCGGVAVTATIKKSKKLQAADKELAAVFATRFPTGLDFDPSHEFARKESTKKFDAWYKKFDETTRAAGEHYRAIIVGAGVAPMDKVIAAARLVQVVRWSAQVIARAQIAKSVAKYPEAVDIYCDTLEDKAEPLEMFAQDAAQQCRDFAAEAKLDAGWWDEVCAP
jgi:hypothetical protein